MSQSVTEISIEEASRILKEDMQTRIDRDHDQNAPRITPVFLLSLGFSEVTAMRNWWILEDGMGDDYMCLHFDDTLSMYCDMGRGTKRKLNVITRDALVSIMQMLGFSTTGERE